MNESCIKILYFIPNLGCCILPHDNGLGELRNACRRLGTIRLVAALKLLNHVVAVLQCHRTVTHGWSGHAWFNVPDVPGLRDRSAIVGDLDELDSAVVIYLCDPHGIQAWIWAMLAFCASFDCHHIAYVVRVRLSLSVFMLVFLNDRLKNRLTPNCPTEGPLPFDLGYMPKNSKRAQDPLSHPTVLKNRCNVMSNIRQALGVKNVVNSTTMC